VKFATSIIDFIFRALGVEYLHRYDLAHIKPEANATPLDAAQHLGTPPEPPSLRQLPHATTPEPRGTADVAPLPHTREATARSAAMSETLGDGTTGSPLDAQLDTMMGDAPVCDVCGHITVRNGACYKCLNCGNSMGCS
jgi:ribonucleoside-diphosphate reductase alpha chain